MTQVLAPPRSSTRSRTKPQVAPIDAPADGSLWARGCLAAMWAVAVGVASLVVLVVAGWAADARSGASAGAAIRTALQLWLAAHRVPLAVPGGTLAVAPLGLTLLLLLLLSRAAAGITRDRDDCSLADLA